MKVRHKRHMSGKHHGGTRAPHHISKNGDGGKGPVEKDGAIYEAAEHSGNSGSGVTQPQLVAGNKVVVKAAKEKKSIGEVPGIFAKERLDRKKRPGGISGAI